MVGSMRGARLGVAALLLASGAASWSCVAPCTDPPYSCRSGCYEWTPVSQAFRFVELKQEGGSQCKVPRHVFHPDRERAEQCAQDEGWRKSCDVANVPWCEGEEPPEFGWYESGQWECGDDEPNPPQGDVTCNGQPAGANAAHFTLHRFSHETGCLVDVETRFANSLAAAKQCASEGNRFDAYAPGELCRFYIHVCYDIGGGTGSTFERTAPTSAEALRCARSEDPGETPIDVSALASPHGEQCLPLGQGAFSQSAVPACP